MAKVTQGTANAAAIIGFLILLCGIAVTTCGIVWVAYGGYLGHGLWSGIPMLVVGILGFVSLTRNNCVFLLYLLLATGTCIAAGMQAVTGGLELQHWSNFLGERKCSINAGVCKCLGQEQIRIKDLDSCDKIPSINDIFISIIFFSIIGSLLCLGGAIAGCVGLATIPRSSPSTLPRKRPAKKPVTGIEVSYQQNKYPPQPEKIQAADLIPKDQYDGGYTNEYKRPRDAENGYGYDRDRDHVREYDGRGPPRDIDLSDRDRGSDYKDNYSDRDSYDRNYYYKGQGYDYDKNDDRYSDRYDYDYRDRDRDDYYDDYDRRSYDRSSPLPDDKTYL